MISNMSEGISSINKDLNFARRRLGSLEIILRTIENAMQNMKPTKVKHKKQMKVPSYHRQVGRSSVHLT